jgi:hypothetical protein
MRARRLTLCAAAVFAFQRSVFHSFGALPADLCRANPIDCCADCHQSDTRYCRAASRPNHRPYHTSDDRDHHTETENQTTEDFGKNAHSRCCILFSKNHIDILFLAEFPHRRQHLFVRSASTQVSGQIIARLLFSRMRVRVEQALHRHDHSRRTESALKGLML